MFVWVMFVQVSGDVSIIDWSRSEIWLGPFVQEVSERADGPEINGPERFRNLEILWKFVDLSA